MPIADLIWSLRFSQKDVVEQPITLTSAELLKISLTTKENGKAKRPHQAFLILKEVESGLEAPFPFTVKESGKGSVTVVSLGEKIITSRGKHVILLLID
jgi:hypothetical protein